jgi:hypothetical protein
MSYRSPRSADGSLHRTGFHPLNAACPSSRTSHERNPIPADRPGRPAARTRRQYAASGDNLWASVMMTVIQPSEGWMEICPLPALNREFIRYTLAETKPWRTAPASW